MLDVAPGWQKIDFSALIESIVELTSPHKIKNRACPASPVKVLARASRWNGRQTTTGAVAAVAADTPGWLVFLVWLC